LDQDNEDAADQHCAPSVSASLLHGQARIGQARQKNAPKPRCSSIGWTDDAAREARVASVRETLTDGPRAEAAPGNASPTTTPAGDVCRSRLRTRRRRPRRRPWAQRGILGLKLLPLARVELGALSLESPLRRRLRRRFPRHLASHLVWKWSSDIADLHVSLRPLCARARPSEGAGGRLWPPASPPRPVRPSAPAPSYHVPAARLTDAAPQRFRPIARPGEVGYGVVGGGWNPTRGPGGASSLARYARHAERPA
jgi:hypothetical protein